MTHFGDQDGKSKTSSAVDSKHYPAVESDGDVPENLNYPSHAEVSARAYQLWEEAGYPDESHQQNWLEAERQLIEARETPVQSRVLAAQAGSVHA